MKIKRDSVDSLFSDYIRKRDKYICQRCKRYYPEGKGLDAHHYFGRRYEGTRFNDDNVFSVCFTCHRLFHENPDEHKRFMMERLGETEYDRLRLRANLYKKKDRKMELIIVKEKLKLLEE